MNNNSKNSIKIYVSVWIIWMALHVLVLLQAGFALRSALLDSIISNVPLLALSAILNNTFRFYKPGPKHAWNLIVWCLFMAIIWLGISGFITSQVLVSDQDFMKFYDSSLLFRFFLAYILIGISALIAWVIQLFISSNEDTQRHYEAERLAKEAELNSLRQQLQPHFLFNSLNSVNALIGTQPLAARKMILELSDFLRGTINKENDSKISLSEEIKHLSLYLEIEKVRFGSRLDYAIDLQGPVGDYKIPPLVILPLIENAIKYGLYDTLGNVCIELKAFMVNSVLKIQVTNPFDPRSAERQKGLGFGLQTLARRLFLIYGRTDLLHTHAEDSMYSTSLIIPKS